MPLYIHPTLPQAGGLMCVSASARGALFTRIYFANPSKIPFAASIISRSSVGVKSELFAS